MTNRDVLNKLHEKMGSVLEKKSNEIYQFIEPYTIVHDDGFEEINIPNEEVAIEYERLQKEFSEIIEEIRVMHQN